jgi:hypothetical protein
MALLLILLYPVFKDSFPHSFLGPFTFCCERSLEGNVPTMSAAPKRNPFAASVPSY